MKKVLASLFLISFLAIMMLPLVASADTLNLTPPNSCVMKRTITVSSDLTCSGTVDINGPNSICCVLNTMYNVSDWFFVILVGLAGIFIVIGAMNLVMAAGNSDKVKTGRDYIMYAAIGLFVAFIAKAIPGLVLTMIK